jgi:YVTN family beta-propeller protein
VEFRILGPFELVEDGRPVEIAGRRQRALLAHLLLHTNEVVSSDRLIDGLWGERPPATAPKVLQNAVSQLRRSLGDELIVTRAPGYVLRVDPNAIDSRRFETLLDQGRQELASGDTEGAASILREALELWRGPPLDEFSYDPFAEAEIKRLEELHVRALEERIEAELALGRHSDLVGELERLVAAQPLRERPRGQLVLALYRSGRQAEALRAYEDGRRLLAEELGIEPGAALSRLEKQILTQDPALEPPPTVPRLEGAARSGPAAGETIPKRRLGRLAFGLAAIALVAAALAAAFLLAQGDGRPAVVPNSLVKIDPGTGEIVDVFRVGPSSNGKTTIVGSYVFFTSDDRETLTRIDVRSGETDTFGGLASPAGTAAGADGTLWVGSYESNNVWQIDADSFEQLNVLELLEYSLPWRVAVGGGSVWVAEGYGSGVSRFNATTGDFQQRHESNGFAAEVAVGEGAAWTAVNRTGIGELLRVDAATGVPQSTAIGRIPFAVAVGFGAVWVSDLVASPEKGAKPEPGKVLRIDPATSALDDVINVGKRPVGLATGGGSVWVANGGERTISEIDPRTNEVVNTIPTQYYPTSVAYGHGFLWASLRPDPDGF